MIFSNSKNSNSPALLPWVIFTLVLGFGLSFLNEGLFHYDSIVLAQAVEKTFQTGSLQPAVNGRFGAVIINSILYTPFFLMGHTADLATRLSSIIFHALSVLVFFHFIRLVFSNTLQATVGALLLAFSPFYFMPNTYGKEHGMSIFFLLLSFLLLQQGIHKNSSSKFFWASTCFAFTINVRESLIWTLPFFVLFYFQPASSEPQIKSFRSTPKTIGAFLVPLLILIGGTFIFHLTGVIHTYYSNGIFWPTFQHAVKDMSSCLPWAALMLIPFGAWAMMQRQRAFLGTFFSLWLCLVFLYGNTIWYAPRHLDSILIPAWILTSYALRILYERFRLIAFVLSVGMILQMMTFMYPMLEFRASFNGEKRFAQFVERYTEPNAVVINEDQNYFLDYYAHRQSLFIPLRGTEQEIRRFIQEADDILSKGIPVYYTFASLNPEYEKLSTGRMNGLFKITPLGRAWREDYHRAEIAFRLSEQTLYRVENK